MKTNYIFSKVTLLISMMVILSIEFASAQGPDIDIWYSDEQSFGQEGVPQRWVNILGNVTDADGVNSLYYMLNGGSNVTLSIGPDSRRLQSSGDFNVDLDVKDLNDGINTVIITATDNLSNQTEHTVTVNYTSTNVWPLPHEIDWQSKATVNEVSQAVDGNWEITSDGIHTVTTGYDRLVAIGDTTWDDYEITVPVTIHSISGGGGIGVLLRWMGHTDFPVNCSQPKCGYLPLGAICWYRGNRLEIYGNDGDILATQTRSLSQETIYMFKARVETNPGVGGLYSFKVWEQSEPEPVGWDITGQESMTDPQNGSLMLISHHGDVTFGNLSISAIPISITNIQAVVHSGNTAATISWNTNVPASSQVAYGLNSGYELGTISDPTLVTSHSMELINLLPDTEYHYQISSISAEADEAITGDLMFTTVTSDIVSDDFHLPVLNPSLWTFVDPQGDCDYDLVGSNTNDAWLNFELPAGTEHQLWNDGIQVPHVRQNCNNADFEVEAKFESPLNLQFQEQGILVRQDDDKFMRFEFFSNSSGIRVYVADFDSEDISTHANVEISPTGFAPLYMRVKRQNNQWTMNYSTDGVNWTQATIFTFDLTVNTIGPYAGNAVGGSSPAFTGSIDYFFNTTSPVVPEDPINPGIVVITSTPVTSAVIGQLYGYDMNATGIPAPTFSLLSAPTGMTIDGSSGLIEWTPDSTGDFNISVQASNTIPSFDIQDFVIHVADTAEGAVSDDFNNPILDATVWSFIDPLGGSGYTMTGSCTENAWINISVPGGSEHQMWTDGIIAPHILQLSGDSDFELEVKFESSLSGTYQEQGILVKQDDANFFRFEFYSNGSNTMVIAATLAGTPSVFPLSEEIKINSLIGANVMAPLYMRVNRTGNQWTQSYSLDSFIWNEATTFSHSLVVTAVGTYAGNAGSNPAHTSSVDYFFNTATPVSPEDAPCTHSITTGTITGSPFFAGTSLSVPYTITGTFNSGNIFTAQLSDAAGSFISPVSIGTLAGTSAETITATIPGSTSSGTDYRIRVIASDPSTTGTDNGADIIINGLPTIDIAVYNINCGKFEVKLKPDINISNSNLTNVQFTIKWPTNSVNLIDFYSDFGVLQQGPVFIEDGINYAVFASAGDIPVNWIAETEYTILSFAHDQSGTGYAIFSIDNSEWSSTNNGVYYVELLGLDHTGLVYQNANNVFLGTCGKLDIKAILEGPYNTTNGLMNTNLNTGGNIPLVQPYSEAPWNYTGTESVALMPVNVVDWVLVELRDAPDATSATLTTRIARQAGLLLNNGTIVAIDGTSLLDFNNATLGQLFIAIWHRNHLGVISATDVIPSPADHYAHDFTTSLSQVYGDGQNQLDIGVYGMIGGDANADGIIDQIDNIQLWIPQAGTAGYLNGDLNLDRQVNNPDKNDLWYENIDIETQVPD